jgi:ATP-dependent helicase/nuclease subunit B
LETVRAAEGQLPNFAELARRAETATSSRIGWPAPADPAEAIDDAEYDLAILSRLSASSGRGAGSARYILTANPYVARALRARFQRWSFRWTKADGLLARSDAALAIMAKHGFAARSYSPTALQNYAGCPYKFFLQAVHGLGPREVPEAIDELDPLQRGSLIHDIQFTLFGRLRDKGLLPVRPQNLNQIWDMLDGVISDVGATSTILLQRSTAYGRMGSRRSVPIYANGCAWRARIRRAMCRGISSCPSVLLSETSIVGPIQRRCPVQSTSIAAFNFVARSIS